jgi:hypothetical protein
MRAAWGDDPAQASSASDIGALPLDALVLSEGAELRDQLAVADEPALRGLLHRVTERLDAIEVDPAALAALHGLREPSRSAEAEPPGESDAAPPPSRQAQAQAGARHAEVRQLELVQHWVETRLAVLQGQRHEPQEAFNAPLWDWRSQQQAIAEAYATYVELDEAQQGLILNDPVTAATDTQSSERVAESFGHLNDMLNRAEREGLARGAAAIGRMLAGAADAAHQHALLEAADALVQVADCYAEAGARRPAVDGFTRTVVHRLNQAMRTAVPAEQRRLAFVRQTEDSTAFGLDTRTFAGALTSSQPPLTRHAQIAASNALTAFATAREHYAQALKTGLAPLPCGEPLPVALAGLHTADGGIAPVDPALVGHMTDYRKHLRQGDRELDYALRQADEFRALTQRLNHPLLANLDQVAPTMGSLFGPTPEQDTETATPRADDASVIAELAPHLNGYAPFLLQPYPYVAVSIDSRVAAVLGPGADGRHFAGEVRFASVVG